MRAFIAIDLPPEIQSELARRQAAFRRLCPEGRWTHPESVHLTLKFLGEITEAQARQVGQALGQLGGFSPFPVEIRNFGFFPDARRPRVFWVGVAASAELQQLAARIEDAMQTLGFPRENRAFTPHLTLARFREPRAKPALCQAVDEQADALLGRIHVSEYSLYESKLKPQGAEYRKLAAFPLR